MSVGRFDREIPDRCSWSVLVSQLREGLPFLPEGPEGTVCDPGVLAGFLRCLGSFGPRVVPKTINSTFLRKEICHRVSNILCKLLAIPGPRKVRRNVWDGPLWNHISEVLIASRFDNWGEGHFGLSPDFVACWFRSDLHKFS